MPNFDGGHYFLTTLAPIRVGAPIDLPEARRSHFDGDPRMGFVQRAQRALGDMPTALQSPATEQIGVPSPFMKSLRTHFCRFVIIEDAVFNGRTGDNALLTSIGKRSQPLEPKHVDRLPCAYLMCCLDIDAVKTPGDPLPARLTQREQDEIRDHYLESIWAEGSAELLLVYENCQEFDSDKIKTPKDFAAYMRRCQMDTWMSYNDYYTGGDALPELPMKALAIAVGVPALAMVASLVAWLAGLPTLLGVAPGPVALVAAALTAIAIRIVYGHIISNGQKAWPPARHGDLPSVLKGLYLQQRFADFVVANQGATATDLMHRFGEFLRDHEPDDVLNPEKTQPPGVIKSRKTMSHG